MGSGSVGNCIEVIDKGNGFELCLDIEKNNYECGQRYCIRV